MTHSQFVDDYMFIEDCEVAADFTIVLGITLWHRPLMRALELYERGLSGTLILSGGHNAKLSASEASQMYNHAVSMGVDRAKMLCEVNSTNTRENFENSFRLISKATAGKRLAINVVAINYHMRRALLTAQNVLPKNTRIGAASYPSIYFSRNDWSQSERGIRDVMCELEKIGRYFPAEFPSEMLSMLGNNGS